MFIITGKFKKDPSYPAWKLTGLDFRPLIFTTYGIAERECAYFQQLNAQHVAEYGDDEVIYEVREWSTDHQA